VNEPVNPLLDESHLRGLIGELASVERWGADPQAPHGEGTSAGRGFTVETVTCCGMHEVVSITPADAVPPSAQERAALHSVVRALLDLAGYEDGPARTEVVLAPPRPRIVSCRVPGRDTDPPWSPPA